MSEPLRLALVGAGGIAHAYEVAIGATDDARLVAVVDPRQEAAAAIAEVFGAQALGSVEELGEGEVDAAIVCTPPATHEAVTIALLSLGAHVLCEKPLAIGLPAAQRMVARAHEVGRLLMMSSKFRYVEDVVRARSLIVSGAIGAPIMFENSFTSRVEMGRRWNSDPAVSGGGVLIDNGTHSVDVFRFLFESITEVSAVEARRIQGLAVEDTAQLFLRSPGEVTGTADLSWTIDKKLRDYVRVHGSDGTIQLGWRSAAVWRSGSPEWTTFGTGYDKNDAFRRVVADFAAAAWGRAEPRITTDEALASVSVIDAAYRSMPSNHWEPVEATVLA